MFKHCSPMLILQLFFFLQHIFLFIIFIILFLLLLLLSLFGSNRRISINGIYFMLSCLIFILLLFIVFTSTSYFSLFYCYLFVVSEVSCICFNTLLLCFLYCFAVQMVSILIFKPIFIKSSLKISMIIVYSVIH